MELSNRSKQKIEQNIARATKEFNRYGFIKTTIDGIAASTGVSKVTIYKYFDNKKTLYEHILKRIYLVEFNAIKNIIESDIPFKEKIDRIIHVRVQKYDDDNILKVEQDYIISDQLKLFNKEHTEKMARLNHQLYEQGKKEGLIRTDITDEQLNFYFAVIRSGLRENFTSLNQFGRENLSKLLEILYAGVLGCPVQQAKEMEQ